MYIFDVFFILLLLEKRYVGSENCYLFLDYWYFIGGIDDYYVENLVVINILYK